MQNQRLMRKLKEAKQQVESYVTRSSVQDFAHYKFAVGQIAGLEAAINICREIFKGEENDEL